MASRIKVLTLSVIFVLIFTLTGCTGGTEAKPDTNSANVPITSEWEYYSLKTNTDTYYRFSFEREEDLPYFRTSDGETCEISTVKGKSYKALITDLGDGNYKISKPASDKTLDMKIEGNVLKISFPQGQVLTFIAK